MKQDSKIYVAGHHGMVGSAIVRTLLSRGYNNIITRTHSELDLINQQAVNDFFEEEKPEHVFLAAAKVGGILANSMYPAEFIYENLMVQCNTIHAAYINGVKKLLFLGSSCVYPGQAPQPIKEEYLLSSSLEPSNEAYAIAKIAGIRMCKHYNQQYGTNFLSVMPTNLYGPGDNYDPETSHAMPALIMKFKEAIAYNKSQIEVWGSGNPRREFLHVDDAAEACVFLMERYNTSDISDLVNIGTGTDITIHNLAYMLKTIVNYKGDIVFNTNKPDGTLKKLLDVSKINDLGWKASISLEDGITRTYRELL